MVGMPDFSRFFPPSAFHNIRLAELQTVVNDAVRLELFAHFFYVRKT